MAPSAIPNPTSQHNTTTSLSSPHQPKAHLASGMQPHTRPITASLPLTNKQSVTPSAFPTHPVNTTLPYLYHPRLRSLLCQRQATAHPPPHRDSAGQRHATAHPLTATALTPRRESRGPTSAVRWAEAAPRPRRWVPACPRWVSYPYAPSACRRGTRSGCDCGRQPADQQCAFDVRAGFTHTHTPTHYGAVGKPDGTHHKHTHINTQTYTHKHTHMHTHTHTDTLRCWVLTHIHTSTHYSAVGKPDGTHHTEQSLTVSGDRQPSDGDEQ